MGDWFAVEELEKDTFCISEEKHWEETHCYLLCGTQSAVLIDTGLGVADIKKVVRALTSLPILVATTHVHWDHIGGHRFFNNIAVHGKEVVWLSETFPMPLQLVKNNLMCQPCDFPSDFDINKYQIFQGVPQKILYDHDCIDLGNRKLIAIHTPGHSPGHCCFYEPERKYLFSGDLIYSGCLDAFYPTTNPLLFWQSVRKIQELDVKRIFPAHHKLDISIDLIDRVEKAFRYLEESGKLKQGTGVFSFRDFQIHI